MSGKVQGERLHKAPMAPLAVQDTRSLATHVHNGPGLSWHTGTRMQQGRLAKAISTPFPHCVAPTSTEVNREDSRSSGQMATTTTSLPKPFVDRVGLIALNAGKPAHKFEK